jgi:hypothetical protein
MQHFGKNGFLFALCGFALLSAGDTVIKSMAGEWPGTAVAALRFCFGAVGLGVILWMKEGKAGFKIPIGRVVTVFLFGDLPNAVGRGCGDTVYRSDDDRIDFCGFFGRTYN